MLYLGASNNGHRGLLLCRFESDSHTNHSTPANITAYPLTLEQVLPLARVRPRNVQLLTVSVMDDSGRLLADDVGDG